MSLFSLLLVVLAAVIHASWNLLAKRASDAGPVFVMAYTSIATLVYLPWAAWIFIESEFVFGVFNTQIIVCIVLSGLLHLAYSLFLQRGYQVADLSVVYPIARGAAPVVSTMGAFLFLGEPLFTGRVIGLIAVVIGVFLVATRGNLIQFRQPSAYKGVSWGGATGAMIAGYSVVDAYGVKILGIHPVLLDWFANLVRLVMLFPWLLSNRKAAVARMSGRWGLALAIGVLSPLSYILVLFALGMGAPLSVVAPAREMSMMVGALLGMIVLHEEIGVWRFVGCLVLVGGVIVLGRS